MQRDVATLNMVPRIFLRVIAQALQSHSPGAQTVDKAALHIGAVAFIHRFGSSLQCTNLGLPSLCIRFFISHRNASVELVANSRIGFTRDPPHWTHLTAEVQFRGL